MTVDTPGTHTLTPEQREQMQARYGERYVAVETGVYGLGMNRKTRRQLAKKKRRK